MVPFVFVGVMAASAYMNWQEEQKSRMLRARALHKVAERSGWTYSTEVGDDLPRPHTPARVSECLAGEWQGRRIAVYDVRKGPGNEGRDVSETVVCLLGRQSLPPFTLQATRHRRWWPRRQPTFLSASFHRLYRLDSNDATGQVARLFIPSVQAWLEAFHPWWVEVQGPWLVLHRGRGLAATELVDTLDKACMLADLLQC